jgi:acyl-CoA thioester hydrolase
MPRTAESRFRVRYAETDQMGVVYHANYFIWMEIGRTDFCRVCGFTYRELEQEENAYIAVAEANCRYMASAKYDDEIVVETSLARANRRILEFAYKIRNATALLAEGRTVHVVVGTGGKPVSLPSRYLELMQSD